MGRLARVTQKIFGSNAAANQIGIFGSLAAGSPTFTTDPTLAQSLSNWLDGWFGAILGSNSPAIEDMNAFCFVVAYQLAYLMQSGIPEYDAGTTYYTNNFALAGGILYISIADNNTGNPVTDVTKWRIWGAASRTITASGAATLNDDMIRVDATAGPVAVTLPAIATAFGKDIKIKKVDSSLNPVIVAGNGSELIDFANTFELNNPGEAVDVRGATSVWDVI